MSRELNFEKLDKVTSEEGTRDVPRWRSREINPVVQMSIRMPVDTYERYRDLCKRERRTNGDMLKLMMESYLARKNETVR